MPKGAVRRPAPRRPPAVRGHPSSAAAVPLTVVISALGLIAATAATALLARYHPSTARFIVLVLGMTLYAGAGVVASLAVDADLGDRRHRGPVVLAALLAGAGLLVTVALPPGAWALGIALVLTRLLSARAAHGQRWQPALYVLSVALAVWWVYLAMRRWDALLWWLIPLALLIGLALSSLRPHPSTTVARPGLGRRRVMSGLALFGLAASIAVLVLLGRSAAASLLIAIEAFAVLMLTPRAAARFGRTGVYGLVTMGAIILAAAFVSAV